MALRRGLKVIGTEIASAYRAASPDRIRIALHGDSWFSCRHCHTVYLPALVGSETHESAECFAHESLCAERPGDLPLASHERAAVETVYGTPIRKHIAELELIILDGPTPDEHARTVERRAALVAELIRVGLPDSREN